MKPPPCGLPTLDVQRIPLCLLHTSYSDSEEWQKGPLDLRWFYHFFNWETTMNEVTYMKNESAILFEYALMAFITWIWRLQMTYPKQDILLAFMDIPAAFRFPRIFADMCGAFGFTM